MIITEISCCKVPSTIPMSDNAWETAWVYARINPPVPSFVPPKYRVTTAATLISWFWGLPTSVRPPFHLVLHHRCFAGFHFSPMMKALQLWFAFQCSFISWMKFCLVLWFYSSKRTDKAWFWSQSHFVHFLLLYDSARSSCHLFSFLYSV